MTQFSIFDPDSIMIYPIPEELTLGRYEVDWAPDLSVVDREWIGVVYPSSARTRLTCPSTDRAWRLRSASMASGTSSISG